jgi:hypothetical protein
MHSSLHTVHKDFLVLYVWQVTKTELPWNYKYTKHQRGNETAVDKSKVGTTRLALHLTVIESLEWHGK